MSSICRFFNSRGGCRNGDRCNFRHVYYDDNERGGGNGGHRGDDRQYDYDRDRYDDRRRSQLSTRDEIPPEKWREVEVMRICPYFNGENGCRYFKSGTCYNFHIKGSLELAQKCFRMLRERDFLFENDAVKQKPKSDKDIHTIHVYDFDKTLFETYNREEGIKKYERTMRQQWPWGYAFYGQEDSLNYPLTPTQGASFKDCCSSLKDDVLVMLMTGRDFNFRFVVQTILRDNKLDIPYLIFKPRGWKLGTMWYKMAMLHSFFKKRFENLKKMVYWEDREDHVKVFRDSAKDLDYEMKINLVTPLSGREERTKEKKKEEVPYRRYDDDRGRSRSQKRQNDYYEDRSSGYRQYHPQEYRRPNDYRRHETSSRTSNSRTSRTSHRSDRDRSGRQQQQSEYFNLEREVDYEYDLPSKNPPLQDFKMEKKEEDDDDVDDDEILMLDSETKPKEKKKIVYKTFEDDEDEGEKEEVVMKKKKKKKSSVPIISEVSDKFFE